MASPNTEPKCAAHARAQEPEPGAGLTMQPSSDLAASMVIVGDVLHDAGTPFLVLDRDMKPGGRIRFTLLQEDGGQGLRIHRTYEPGRLLRVEPLGAARVVQASFHLQVSVSNFLKEPA